MRDIPFSSAFGFQPVRPAKGALPVNDLWYCAKDDKPIGPFTFAQLEQLAKSGMLTPTSVVLRNGEQEWKSAGLIPGLFPASPAAQPVPTRAPWLAAPPQAVQPTPSIPPTIPAPSTSNPNPSRTSTIVGCLLGLLVVYILCTGFKPNGSAGISTAASRNQAEANIKRVLIADKFANRGAKSVAEIAQRIRDIDTTGCPNDFRSAYLAYLHAWEMMAEVEKDTIAHRKDANSGAAVVESFIRGFVGDPLGKPMEIMTAEKELQRRFREAQLQVQSTWHKVEEVAVANGASLPKK